MNNKISIHIKRIEFKESHTQKFTAVSAYVREKGGLKIRKPNVQTFEKEL